MRPAQKRPYPSDSPAVQSQHGPKSGRSPGDGPALFTFDQKREMYLSINQPLRTVRDLG